MIKKIIFTLLLASTVYSQNFKISGMVINEETNEPIPYINIRIAGTAQGTSSNLDGKFILTVPKDKSKLIFTAVGFKKKELEINSALDGELKILLKPEPIQFMEIVIGSNEDPAYRIVREAIKRKEQNRAGLKSLEYDFFSKDIFLSAGKVAMVSEKFSTGYFQPQKYEKIITHSVHITENEKKNALAFDKNILDKMYIDFTDDTLMIVGNKVFLPLAYNAFDWYDYKLLEVKQSGAVHECYIQVIPRSKLQPLLTGKIVIEDSSYSLKSVQLKNNDGLRFPYVNDLNVQFIQNRDRFDDYWLPTYLKVESSLKLSLAGLIATDLISMNQVSMFTNYKINQVIPDSVYTLYSTIKQDSSKNPQIKYVKTNVLNRTEIDSLRPIPLTTEEIKAYAELDSTKKLVTQIKYTGLLSGVVTEAVNRDQNDNPNSGNGFFNYAGKVLSFLRFRDNRVGGLLLGVHYNGKLFNNIFNFDIGLGYAFGRKTFEGSFSSSIKTGNGIIDNLNFLLFNEAKQWQILNPYPDYLNGINVLFGFSDQFNYYLSKGFSIGFTNHVIKNFSVSLQFIYEQQKSLQEFKYQSFFNNDRMVRTNPQIKEGNDNRISFNILIGKNPQDYQPFISHGLIAQFDFSNPIINSDFNYKRFRIISQLSTKTFYGELFSAPYFLIGIEGGMVLGDFGPQHIITPNTALNFYSPFLCYKGLAPYEYVGDKFIGIHAEHNWRTIPFQSADLYFITDLSIDLITGINLLKIWNESSYFTDYSHDEIYWEAYLSFGKIFGVGRIDFSYGANQKFVVRAGLSTLL